MDASYSFCYGYHMVIITSCAKHKVSSELLRVCPNLAKKDHKRKAKKTHIVSQLCFVISQVCNLKVHGTAFLDVCPVPSPNQLKNHPQGILDQSSWS